MYRLLAIDLDGTLLSPEKLITPRTYNLLCQIEQKGVAIVIATGQTAQVLRAVCAKLPLTAPQIIEPRRKTLRFSARDMRRVPCLGRERLGGTS